MFISGKSEDFFPKKPPGFVQRFIGWPFAERFTVLKLIGMMLLFTLALFGLYQWRAADPIGLWTSLVFLFVVMFLYGLAYALDAYFLDEERAGRKAVERYDEEVWDPRKFDKSP